MRNFTGAFLAIFILFSLDAKPTYWVIYIVCVLLDIALDFGERKYKEYLVEEENERTDQLIKAMEKLVDNMEKQEHNYNNLAVNYNHLKGSISNFATEVGKFVDKIKKA